MSRAHRYFLPGYLWHLTHRCRGSEFLLKFSRDRQRWLFWLFEAKKRYGLCVLNYIVTSNHIHLLVKDTGGSAIPRSIQLVAGRTAQEFNYRMGMKGAFWEDRYHATAVESDHHFMRCMVYIDLNMVRAGVVSHPCDWLHSGYREILSRRKRYRIIDRVELMRLLDMKTEDAMIEARRNWVEGALSRGPQSRQERWTRSLAVGGQTFLETIRGRLGFKARARQIHLDNGVFVLKEGISSYDAISGPKNEALRSIFQPFWQ